MHLKLERFSYSPTETEGRLYVNGDVSFATIEPPWIPNPNGARGGKPFESCVPNGMYVLLPWKRPDGDEVYLFYNPQLGVHILPEDHEKGIGRDLCLIHAANFAHEVVGCIAPGKERTAMDDGDGLVPAVAWSRSAMETLQAVLGFQRHMLTIVNAVATSGDD